MATLDRTARQIFFWEFVKSFCAGDALFLRAQGDAQLSLREGPAQPALPRRACAAPLSQRRGTLHRLQAVRGDLPGAGHHHRSRTARRRQPPHDALRHRHGEVHLLRLSARKPARSMRSWKGRISNSPPRPARNSITTRTGCSRTATAGSARSRTTSNSTRRIARDEMNRCCKPSPSISSRRS